MTQTLINIGSSSGLLPYGTTSLHESMLICCQLSSETNVNEKPIDESIVSFKNMHLEMPSAKQRPFFSIFNALTLTIAQLLLFLIPQAFDLGRFRHWANIRLYKIPVERQFIKRYITVHIITVPNPRCALNDLPWIGFDDYTDLLWWK